MSPTAIVILALGAVGHVALWVDLVNRIHAVGIRRRWIDLLTAICGVMLFAMPLAVGAGLPGVLPARFDIPVAVLSKAMWRYVALCAMFCVVAIIQRCVWYYHPERRGALLSNHTSFLPAPLSDKPLTAPGIPTWLSRLPLNEVLKVCVQDKEIAIPRLAQSREPLRIVHLSDLHMSGRITRIYFERVVEEVNALGADLVAITGDIVEREQCLDWIPTTLGGLRATSGVYYVLGNHDGHVNKFRLNAALADAGLVYLGGTYRQISMRGIPVILAGNELPWYWPAADLRNCPAHNSAGLPLRILLAHSPDQLNWAREHEFDLMLAGHLHGGQVRFPLVGAIFAPSHHGVRYAAGVFTVGKSIMHVSRGTGSLTPLRYNCPPEIALLTLRAARTT